MPKALEIRRVSPVYLPKSGCGVPPQSVREASRLPSSAPKLTLSRLNRIQGVWESLGWRSTAKPPRPQSSSLFQLLSVSELQLLPNRLLKRFSTLKYQ
jgi:hypothetical protein